MEVHADSVVRQVAPAVVAVSALALGAGSAMEAAIATEAAEGSVVEAAAEAVSTVMEAAARRADLVGTAGTRAVTAMEVASEAATAVVEAVAAAADSDQGHRLALVVDIKCVAFKLNELLSPILCDVYYFV